jgi:hypothetical protein
MPAFGSGEFIQAAGVDQLVLGGDRGGSAQ